MLPLEVLDSGLSSSVGLSSGESSNIGGRSNIGAEQLFLGSDDLGSSGNIGDLEEASDGVTVGIVGACSCSEACRQLRSCSSEGEASQGEHEGHHLDMRRQGKTFELITSGYHRNCANTNIELHHVDLIVK